MWLVVGWVAGAWAECSQATTLAQLQGAIAQAETAYSAVDLGGFERAVEAARATLPCLGEVVTPSTAAALHRIEGLSAFAASDPDRAQVAFAAARRLEPFFVFPETLVPEDNPVLAHYGALDPSAGSLDEIPAPLDGTLRIDGRPTRVRSVELAQTLQWISPSGSPRLTTYAWPGDPYPTWPRPAPSAPRSNRQRNLGIGASIGAVVAGGLYGAAAGVHATWQSPDTPEDRLAGLRTANNGLVLGSGVALGSAIALGIGALAVQGP